MPLFRWEARFETGIREIDDQHKRLIWLINDLHEAMKEGRGRETISFILAKLLDYSIYHFRTEEGLMEGSDYPFSAEHIKQHAEFILKVQDLSKRFDSGEFMITVETNEFLKEWLTGHILGTDKEMAPFLR